MDGFVWWSRIDPSLPNTEYKFRLEIYEELKALPPELNLFDPAVWE